MTHGKMFFEEVTGEVKRKEKIIENKNVVADITDKVVWMLYMYPKAETWSFNKFVRMYYGKWAKIKIPEDFDNQDCIETVGRVIRRLKEQKRLVKEYKKKGMAAKQAVRKTLKKTG